MRLMRWAASALLLGMSMLHAQNQNTVMPGPANIAGTLYASNFAQWTIAQGSSPANGQISWSSPTFCRVTSGGITFTPLTIGTPITIVDNNPAHSETVTVSQFLSGNNGCSIQAAMSFVHYSYHIASATAGLQEAINWAADTPYMVVITTDFTRSGGTTSTITSAKGNSNVSVLDERTSVILPYVWDTGSNVYVATPFGGGGGGGTPAGVFEDLQLNGGGPDPAFAADSGFLQNNSTLHNLHQQMLDDIPYAAEYQSGGGGNGLANAVAHLGANQTIFLTDADGPSEQAYQQVLPQNTTVTDYRAAYGEYGIYQYDPATEPIFFGGFAALTSSNQSHVLIDSAVGSLNNGGYAGIFETADWGPGYSYGCCGNGNALWTTGGQGLAINSQSYRSEINAGLTVGTDKYGMGDNNGILLNTNSVSGGESPSDQGLTAFAVQGGQPDVHTFFQIASTTGVGDQAIVPNPIFPGLPFYERINVGTQAWLIDLSKPVTGSTGAVTWAILLPGSYGQGMTPGTHAASCSGGGGSGAAVNVDVDSGGAADFVTLISGGSAYTSSPTCVLTTAGGTGPTIITSIGVTGTFTSTTFPIPNSHSMRGIVLNGTPLTPSTGDVLTSSSAPANTANPGNYVTDTITAVVNNNHPIDATTDNGTAWMASNDEQPERVKIISVSGGTTTGSTQTIVLQHINQIDSGMDIYQGGTQGCLILEANYDNTGVLGCYFLFGSYDNHTGIYGWLSHGGFGNPIGGGSNMFANNVTGSNTIHVIPGANVLYTTPAISEQNLGGIGGQPHMAVNPVSWAANDWVTNTEPVTWDVSGALLVNLFSNTSADNGDNIIAVLLGGMHWTSNTTAIFLDNGNDSAIYTQYGGALSAPNGIELSGVWNNGLTISHSPTSCVICVTTATGKFVYLGGPVSLTADVPNNLWDLGTSGLTAQGTLTSAGMFYYGNPGALTDKQLIHSADNGSTTYTSLGDGTSNNGIFGLQEVDAAIIRAGIQAPASFFFSGFASGGTTTYTYVATSVNTLGGETLPGSPISNGSGPSSLSSGNSNGLQAGQQAGADHINIYRTAGTGGVGLVCSISAFQTCNDTGQTATSPVPTVDTSGVFFLAGKELTSVLGVGTELPSATGTFTPGHLRSTDTNGTEIDANVNVIIAAPSPNIGSKTASNSDLDGELTFAGATTASYTFQNTYTSHPECIVTPQATTASAGHPWVTYTGVASFTINFTSAFTGNVSYMCPARN